MRISARNQLSGTVVSVVRGPVNALVKIDVGGQHISATLTVDAAEDLGIAPGSQVTAIFKASSVLLGVED